MKYPDDFINKIICGDCLEVMGQMPQKAIDVILTSPPYNTARNVKTDRGLQNLENRYIGYEDNKSDSEYQEWSCKIFNAFDRILKTNGSVLYNISYSSENTYLMWLVVAGIIKKTNFVTADCIAWKKDCAIPNNVSPNKLTRIIEYVFVFCRKNELETFRSNKKITGVSSTGQNNYQNIQNIICAKNNDGSREIHKAQYSTELCVQLLDIYASPKSIIYDPFLGTGTTAVAAKSINHNYVGTEIIEDYVALANKRLKNTMGSLF